MSHDAVPASHPVTSAPVGKISAQVHGTPRPGVRGYLLLALERMFGSMLGQLTQFAGEQMPAASVQGAPCQNEARLCRFDDGLA